MAARLKGRKLKDIPIVIQENSFIKDFNSNNITFLSLMNDKLRAEALEKKIVHYYTHKCNSGDKYRVLVIADDDTIANFNIQAKGYKQCQ